jgi:hypothetical protein
MNSKGPAIRMSAAKLPTPAGLREAVSKFHGMTKRSAHLRKSKVPVFVFRQAPSALDLFAETAGYNRSIHRRIRE